MSRILVIDQGNIFPENCRSWLLEADLEVVYALTREQALTQVRENSFDLILVIDSGQGNDWFAVYQEVLKVYPTMSGILITPREDAATILQAINGGFSRVCNLPPVKQQLQKAVSETLKLAALREDVTRMKTLLPLYSLGQRFLRANSEDDIYGELAEVLEHEMSVSAVSVLIYDGDSESLEVVAYKGIEPKYVEGLKIKPGERITGKVFLSRKPVILNRDGNGWNPYAEHCIRKELSAAISFPLINKKKVLGVINISEKREGVVFSDSDLEMLSVIADQAIMALEYIRSVQARVEENRLRTLLEQYVSPEVSRLLVNSQVDLLDHGNLETLTVMFADIRNFTYLVQKVGPQTLRLFLNNFFELFSSTVFYYHGMVDKFIGDAALAVFGAPVRIDDASAAAIQSSRLIMGKFGELQKKWAQTHAAFKEIGLGIGVSRGPIYLGNIGSERRFDYTVIGIDVNIAQRLASETQSGKILVTKSIERELGGDFSFQMYKKMKLRGVENEVEVFELDLDK